MLKLRYPVLLASQSPRRRQLLAGLDIPFEVNVKDTAEVYPSQLKGQEVALYLSELKASAYDAEVTNGYLVITADTIVCLDERIIGKPSDPEEAVQTLELLSGKMHTVYTAVCLRTLDRKLTFYSATRVFFRELSGEEIRYYVNTYRPFDKAGAYGAQEWIGYVAIEKIEGSYFNVMGLPVKELYSELRKFCYT